MVKLFFYFSSVDQGSHMLWRYADPEHPAYDPETDPPFADVIPEIYEQMDAVVGYTLEHMGDDTTLVVMSDHGFSPWRRAFHLNTWLRDNGWLAVKPGAEKKPETSIFDIDWSRTAAYGIGFNALYLNLKGREGEGIIDPAKVTRSAIQNAASIAAMLLTTEACVTDEPSTTRRASAWAQSRTDSTCVGAPQPSTPEATTGPPSASIVSTIARCRG